LWIAPGETKEVTFILGQGKDRQQANALLAKYRDIDAIEQSWKDLNAFWDDLLGRVTVNTPDPAMDMMLNRWLLYQSLSCRIWGRSALYQSSGAFGFRDQLQDVMSLIDVEPSITRAHILESARHQFEAGDVLHWWHPPSGRGVRTRCSDDLLWLPYFTAQYVHRTGDLSILEESIPFLEGVPLGDEHERYDHYQPGRTEETILEHCHRALKRGTTRGAHGLPLIGSHDWNDGLSRVGLEGQGESVWNGWFLYDTLMLFADLCEQLDDRGQATRYRKKAQKYLEALEKNAWDGEWYLRAFYDDGTPLGSSESLEGQIDSLSQSWGVLTSGAQPDRARQAMEAVYQKLVKLDEQMILLFTPPFDQTEHDPGYIKGYPPGIRENGGQYTHAAIWAVWAFARLGDGDRAGELFKLLNPIYHAMSPEKAKHYRVEPYVVAADVYGAEPYTGRGGWTWYTGSAGWMYRLGVEAILGLRREGEKLKIDPCIPKDWPGYEMTYRVAETEYQIKVENPDRVNRGVRQILMDGEQIPGDRIQLEGDGKLHQVVVVLGE
jgi:cyclic beta-1,2-glucan synthetase